MHFLKFKSKHWITLALQKSIFVKNKLLTNFINKKDPMALLVQYNCKLLIKKN